MFILIIHVNMMFEGLVFYGTLTMWRRMIWWKLIMESGKSSLDVRRWLIIWLMGLKISTKNSGDSQCPR